MKLTSSDIINWPESKKKESEQYLPLLIRRLIRETGYGITKMRFPAGDATQYTGLDGIVESMNDTPFIPDGDSVWECGTDKVVKIKAEKVYMARTKDKNYVDKKTSFIFVTPRVWDEKKKNAWIKEKKKDKKWKNVIVYDAIDLEEWLEQAPSTATWFATELLGKYPTGVQSIESYWKEWAANENQPLTTGLVSSGRSEQLKKIQEWIKGKACSFTLKALTQEEALIFLYASIDNLSINEKEDLFSRTLIVKDIETMRKITIEHSNHVLINYFPETTVVNQAIFKNHHVFVAAGPDSSFEVSDELQVLKRSDLVNELEKIGFSKDDAEYYSKESGRSLSVLKRLLVKNANQPNWAKAENAQDLIPLLFAGRWNERNENDKMIISKIAGTSYDEYIKKLTIYKNSEDPPIYQIGELWRLTSPLDAWYKIYKYLNESDFKTFEEVVLEVLGESDPEFDLDENERYKASMFGKVRKYSGWLREGILQALVLCAVHGKKQEWVNMLVAKLVKNADSLKWFSIAGILPQLAEASPDAFLNSIEESLNSKEQSILVLFREGDNILFSRCNHSGLLWGLEGLAWFPEYLNRVTVILGKLSSLDPGGKWSNRPIETLRAIFLPWLPYTLANIEQRMQAIDVLIERSPNIAFGFLLNLLPKGHDIGTPIFQPRWRGFSLIKAPSLTYGEIWKTESEILNRLIKLSDTDGNKFSQLIPSYDDMHLIEDREKILNTLKNNVNVFVNGGKEIWERLRDIISRHNSFPNTDWVMPKEEIEKLKDVYLLYSINDSVDKNKWLFDDWSPQLLDGERGDYKEYEKKIEEQRINAVIEIYKEKGLELIFSFAYDVKQSFTLGEALAKSNIVDSENEVKILKYLDKVDKGFEFARGYFYHKIRSIGDNWITKTVEILLKNDYQKDIITNFLILLDSNMKTWEIIRKFSKEIQDHYWNKNNSFMRELSEEGFRYGYGKLLEYKRYLLALDSASIFTEGVPTEIIVSILEKAASEESNEPYKMRIDPHHVASLFKELDKRNYDNKEKMLRLEWLYLQVLTDDIWNREPKLLFNDMAENPESFIQVVKMIYKPNDDIEMEKDEKKGISEEQIILRANQAYKLLRSFNHIPGSKIDGDIDFEILLNWISKVRELAKNCKRETAVDSSIGNLLSSVDINSIPDSVCRIFEEMENETIEKEFVIGVFNRRGITTRAVFEGGDQERELAKTYKEISEKLGAKYIRISKVFLELSKDYEHYANRIDKEAKQDESDY